MDDGPTLNMRIRVVEGNAMFDSLVELAELTKQHAELSEKISALSKEIREMVTVKAEASRPN